MLQKSVECCIGAISLAFLKEFFPPDRSQGNGQGYTWCFTSQGVTARVTMLIYSWNVLINC